MLTFYCIGSQKSGTTWLYHILKQHPELALIEPKEVHYWDMYYSTKSIHWYKKHYTHPHLQQGDFTPAYAILPKDKIKECFSLFPDLKLIYIIRDPFDRMWSAVKAEIRKENLNVSTLKPEFYFNFFEREDTIQRSDYQTCIENWLSVYDQNRLLVLDFKTLVAEPRAFIEKVQRFLGLSLAPFSDETLHAKIYEGLDLKPDDEIQNYLQEKMGYLVNKYELALKKYGATF